MMYHWEKSTPMFVQEADLRGDIYHKGLKLGGTTANLFWINYDTSREFTLLSRETAGALHMKSK